VSYISFRNTAHSINTGGIRYGQSTDQWQ
jgi:hypothetical protein